MAINYEIPVYGRMLKIREVGGAFGVADKTVRNWISLGNLAHFKIGGAVRVAESEVLQILARSHRPGDK